ncbi:MAG: PH domain-containing protein [Bacilli bacterium]|nr:PH domain-containing protein [Bacilli bacterium]
MSKSLDLVKQFKSKYPLTVAFRIARHCEIIDMHLNPDEKILYAFAAQKNESSFQFFNTNVIVLTTKRIMIATKRVIWGYFFISITPDMFNDITISKRLIWGEVNIDTIKETVLLTNIDPKALPEIETIVSDYMMEEKKKYATEK